MSQLAKSSHVVLREGAANLKAHGAPAYVVDRMAVLAEIQHDNQTEGARLVRVIYGGLAGEAEALGYGESEGGE